MNIEQERNTLIHLCYTAFLLFLFWVFLKYIIYSIMPFLLGFLIAFSLRPMIRTTNRFLPLPAKVITCLYLLVFYGTIGSAVIILCIQGYHFLKDFLMNFPNFYQMQIEPALYSFILRMEHALAHLDPKLMSQLQQMLLQANKSIETFALTLSSSIISHISTMAASLPNLLLSFFMTILSSIFFAMDFPLISRFIMRQFPSDQRAKIYVIREIVTDTILQYLKAYGKLMCLTFFELSLGLLYLRVDGAIIIAFIIAFFDIFPILGTGTIIFPWVVISFLNHQTKFAVGLLILHLIINLIRQVLEPRIVGKQMGLHPLLMLACMFFGVKLFGILGIFMAPILIQIFQRLHEAKILHVYH